MLEPFLLPQMFIWYGLFVVVALLLRPKLGGPYALLIAVLAVVSASDLWETGIHVYTVVVYPNLRFTTFAVFGFHLVAFVGLLLISIKQLRWKSPKFFPAMLFAAFVSSFSIPIYLIKPFGLNLDLYLLSMTVRAAWAIVFIMYCLGFQTAIKEQSLGGVTT